MCEFIAEIRARKGEGYSMRQLMLSHIPDIGSEVKISAAEVNAALKKDVAARFFFSVFLAPRNHSWGVAFARQSLL